MLDILKSRSLRVHTPKEEQRHLPTSRPRKQGIRGNVIDVIASARVEISPVSICRDGCDILGSDHELVTSMILLQPGAGNRRRFDARPRVVVKPLPNFEEMNEEELNRVARECTKGPPGKCYKDTAEVKAKFQRARDTKQAGHWTEALQARRQARMQWERERLDAAASGDWRRGLLKRHKEHRVRPSTNTWSTRIP